MSETREKLKKLIKKKCVAYGDFTLSSGLKSSFYLDLRRAVLDPEGMVLIGDVLVETLKEWKPYAVAGEGLGATPLVCTAMRSAKAQGTSLYGCLVRKQPKGHGTKKRVEGTDGWPEKASIIVLEDTCTTGESLLECCEALKEVSVRVLGGVCLVNRGGDAIAREFESRGMFLRSVFALSEIVEIVEGKGRTS